MAHTEAPDPIPPAEAAVVGGCPRCFAPLPAQARFCPFCGTPAVAGATPQALRGRAIERRQLTVVFCDLVDSVGLSTRLDPEDLTEVIHRFHRCVAAVMEAHGGMVARRLGDGALVYFGYPQAQEDDPERAVLAALALIEAIGLLEAAPDARLQVRVGAATGIAIVGDVSGAGATDGLEVAGEAPNLAARLQGLAAPGTVLASAALHALTPNLFAWRDRGPHTLKGWAEPVPVWQPTGRARGVSRFDARRRQHALPPMVGRTTAAARLLACWRSAQAGQGRAVLIRGDAGIGKSRLLAHVLRTPAERHLRLRYFCSPHQREAPLFPILQHVEQFAGIQDQDDAEARRAKLLRSFSVTPERELAFVAALLMAPLPGHEQIAQMAPDRRRQQTLEALHAISVLLTRAQPVLTLFEDAHWADPSSLELLTLGVRRIASLPALLLVTARPEFDPEWLTDAGAEVIDLDPLDPADSARLVHAVGGATLPVAVTEEIVRRADGVPLYIEELTRSAVEAGATLPPATLPHRGREEAFAVPPSIHALLLGRLDRLEEAREVAEVAATIGRDFGRELLRRVTGLAEELLDGALGKLLAGGLAMPAGAAGLGLYRFRHALIRDAAYGSVVRVRRRELHARIAGALEAEQNAQSTTRPQLLAYHYTEAGMATEAARWWLRAGLQSLAQSAVAEAVSQLRRGLDQVAELPQAEPRWRLELDLLIAYVKALFAPAGWAGEATAEGLTRARVLCEKLDSPGHLRTVMFGQWTQAFLRAELAGALAQAEGMLARGQASGEAEWRVIGLYCTGMTLHSCGDFGTCDARLAGGLALFEAGRRERYAGPVVSDPRVIMLSYLAWARLCTGRFAEADAGCAQAMVEARAFDQVLTLAHALYRCAYHATFAHSAIVGLEALEPLHSVTHEHGLSYYHSLGTIHRGWCLAMAGDPPSGLAVLRDGLATYRRHGNRLYLPSFWRMEAEVLGRCGLIQEGLGRVVAAAELMAVTGEGWDDAEIDVVHAGLLALAGDRDGAAARYRVGLRRASARDAGWFALRAANGLARMLAEDGRREEAAAILKSATAKLRDPDLSADLRVAQALLAAL